MAATILNDNHSCVFSQSINTEDKDIIASLRAQLEEQIKSTDKEKERADKLETELQQQKKSISTQSTQSKFYYIFIYLKI